MYLNLCQENSIIKPFLSSRLMAIGFRVNRVFGPSSPQCKYTCTPIVPILFPLVFIISVIACTDRCIFLCYRKVSGYSLCIVYVLSSFQISTDRIKPKCTFTTIAGICRKCNMCDGSKRLCRFRFFFSRKFLKLMLLR